MRPRRVHGLTDEQRQRRRDPLAGDLRRPAEALDLQVPALRGLAPDPRRAARAGADYVGEADMTKCHAVQYADLMTCEICNLVWEANDLTKPVCRPGETGLSKLPSSEEQPGSDDYVGGLEYRGNSVSFIYQKATAYRLAIDEAWAAMRSAGFPPDGKTKLADAIRAAFEAQTGTQPAALTASAYLEGAKRLAHAYADAKLVRYGMNSTDPLSADPEQAFAELLAHIQRGAVPELGAPYGSPATKQGCDMGVGCETAGVCYAVAHGRPEMCREIPVAAPKAVGVSRMADNPKAVMFVFDREPSDTELRVLHDSLRGEVKP